MVHDYSRCLNVLAALKEEASETAPAVLQPALRLPA